MSSVLPRSAADVQAKPIEINGKQYIQFKVAVDDERMRSVPGYGAHDNFERASISLPKSVLADEPSSSGEWKTIELTDYAREGGRWVRDVYTGLVEVKPGMVDFQYAATVKPRNAPAGYLQHTYANHSVLASANNLSEAQNPSYFFKYTPRGGLVEVASKFMGQRDNGSAFTQDYKFDVSYNDIKNHFQGRREIYAHVNRWESRLHKAGMWRNEPKFEGFDVKLVLKDGRYQGDFSWQANGDAGDNVTTIDEMKLSFHAPGSEWDSNGGANFDAWFPFDRDGSQQPPHR